MEVVLSQKFCPNLSLLWSGLPLAERFERAAVAGFGGVELWWPGEVDGGLLGGFARDAGVEVVLLNFPAGDMAAGERGLASDPGRVEEFRVGVEVALEAAAGTGCRRFNALLGLEVEGLGRDAQLACARENLAWAADRALAVGAVVLVEPVNVADNGPYLVPSTAEAVALIGEVGRENVRLQADVYHMVRSGEEPLAELERHWHLVEHVQVADAPGRGEPGTGAIDFAQIFALLDRRGYDGWVGLEYRPSTDDTDASLGWIAASGAATS
jgi:hydroxypyruvate isomerase